MFALPWFWIWVILAAALYVGEMLTASFFLLPFAIGATIALIANFLGADLWLQWLLFILISVIALIAFRPLAKRLTAKADPEKSGVDRLVGKTGTIVEGLTQAGRMRASVDHEIWTVTTETSQQLPENTLVKVLRVEGTHLVVTEA
jgi:membrane protein implicated in regulation of membrane protease activity